MNDSTKMTVEECLPPQDMKAKEMLKTAHFVWLYFHIANKLVKEVLCHICQIHLHNLMVKANQVFYKNKSTCI